LAAVLGLTAPFAALAAGLGRLTVLSTLGAALNAEIEIVSLQPGEEDNLTARVASAEAFRDAGIEPTAALRTIRFAVARRDGRPVLRVTSSAPVNEPFVDLLVELEWPGGRLVREYTMLLDPPEYRTPQAIAAVPEKPAALTAQPLPPLEAKPQAQPQAPFEVRNDGTALAPVQDTTQGTAQAQPPAERAENAAAENAPSNKPAAVIPMAGGANTYEVKRGDTLGEIARANLAPGVSLNQMMIALYRTNQDAFLRENINLVRAGRVLNIPSADAVSGIEGEEANRLVQSHRTEWEDYRSRLAAQPAPAEAASGRRAVTGKIEAKPEATAPGASEDRVRLSKADPAKPGATSRAARADDAAARERALQEAQSRVTDLEKNVADLQKLLELKNQQLAEMEKKAAAAKPAAKGEPAKPEPVKPEAAKPAPPVVAEAPKPAAAAPAPDSKKAEPAPAVAPSPEAKKAEAPKPKPKAAPPPPPPPSLLDEFLDNPIALAGAGAVLVLLLGYGLWSFRRKRANQAKFSDSVLGGTAPSFKEPGGAISGASSQASVSQASGMEAEEVDPIAEADVYMAYGRDAQAEEILREALQKDPNRMPVHAKLLEIYAKRNDTRSFEQSALKLKNLTNGSGPDWDKAAALGRSIDPANALYGGGGAGAPSMAIPAVGTAFAGAAAAAPAIDFDIGGGTSPGMVSTDIQFDEQPKPVTPSSIDFDLGAGTSPQTGKAADADATIAAMDFDLGAATPENQAAAPAMAGSESAASASGLDFDLNLDLGDQGGSPEKSIPSMDLSSISLDLGSTTGEAGGAASSNDPKWQEVATKLDLAKAYEEMGDKDGARELLGEVMKDGDATQKGQAEQLLSKLG
jgi:pilus assembly protein FimV